jgi:hypothetical protein
MMRFFQGGTVSDFFSKKKHEKEKCMKSRTLFILVAMTLLLASAAFVTPIPAAQAQAAQAQTASGAGGGFVSSPAQTTQLASAAVASYWTQQRMAAAVPMDKTVTASNVKGSIPAPASVSTTGTAGSVAGNAPGKAQASATTLADQGTTQPAAAVAAWYSYPFPYSVSGIGGAWPTYYPLSTNGKLYFTQYGTNYVCSGTSVTSNGGSQRLVDTAGHCVYSQYGLGDPNGWSYNVYFCPAYYNGVGPWGCWTSLQLYSFSVWTNNADLRYDQGYIITSDTSTNGYGRLGSTVGTQGFAWNQSYVQDFWSFGYPQAAPYSGGVLILTTSSTAQADDPTGSGYPYTIGIGSDETGGSSGGGWIINARLGAPGYVNSHNDYKYTSPSMPLAMYGPYYGQWTHDLWDYVRTLYP